MVDVFYNIFVRSPFNVIQTFYDRDAMKIIELISKFTFIHFQLIKLKGTSLLC